ncbi:hypothetical protein F4679DRAFT_404318 [Xylaria curta]|nr:hypothetical protein F4679DRAFT_404318 [Xylaria curta]
MPRPQSEQSSSRAVGGRKFIAFFHPSYPDTAPPLLTLAAVEYVLKGAQIITGLGYDTAKAACGIVACNRYDEGAYFALKDRKGVYTRVERPADGLLRADGDFIYYFVVDTPAFCYPVVPSFDHWRFPHQGLPPQWASLPGPEHPTDGRVGHRDGVGEPVCFKETDVSRVAPFSHTSWCDSNLMERFCRKHGTGVPCLSTDIERYFPYHRMDLMLHHHYRPKHFELHPELILQDIMNIAGHQVRSNNYNHSPIRFDGVTREHLFACFAFHILSDANYRFLSGPLRYTVRLFDAKTAEESTVELDSEGIAEISHIFPSPAITAPQFPGADGFYECDESDESDESDDDAGSGCSQESSSYDYPYYTSERRKGRERHRSSAHHRYRDRFGDSQQGQDDADHTELSQDRPRSHHTGNMGGRSLSPTLSISSLDTPQACETPEGMAICDDTPSYSTEIISSKRSYDDYIETPDVAQFHKRLCLR